MSFFVILFLFWNLNFAFREFEDLFSFLRSHSNEWAKPEQLYFVICLMLNQDYVVLAFCRFKFPKSSARAHTLTHEKEEEEMRKKNYQHEFVERVHFSCVYQKHRWHYCYSQHEQISDEFSSSFLFACTHMLRSGWRIIEKRISSHIWHNQSIYLVVVVVAEAA